MTSRPAGDDRRAVGRPRLSGTRRGLGRRIYGVVLFTYVVVLIIHMLALAGIEPMPRSARFDAAWPRILVEANAVWWFWRLTGLVVVGCLLAFGPMLREEYDDGGATSATTRRWKPTGRIIYITGGAVGLTVALVGVIHLVLGALLADENGPQWLLDGGAFASAMMALGGSILGFAGLAWSLSARQDHTEWLEGAERRRERLETLSQTVADVGNVLAECDQLAGQGFEILSTHLDRHITREQAGGASFGLTRFDVLFDEAEIQRSALAMADVVAVKLVTEPTLWRAYEQFIVLLDGIAREMQRDAASWVAQYEDLRAHQLSGVSREVPTELLSFVDDLEMLYELFRVSSPDSSSDRSVARAARDAGSLHLVAFEAVRSSLQSSAKTWRNTSKNEDGRGSSPVQPEAPSDQFKVSLEAAVALLAELTYPPGSNEREPEPPAVTPVEAPQLPGTPEATDAPSDPTTDPDLHTSASDGGNAPGDSVKRDAWSDLITRAEVVLGPTFRIPKLRARSEDVSPDAVLSHSINQGYRDVLTQIVLASAAKFRRQALRDGADVLVRRAEDFNDRVDEGRRVGRSLSLRVTRYLEFLSVEPRRFWQHVRFSADPAVKRESWTEGLERLEAAIEEGLRSREIRRQGALDGPGDPDSWLGPFRRRSNVPRDAILPRQSSATPASLSASGRGRPGRFGAVTYQRRPFGRVALDRRLDRTATGILQHAGSWQAGVLEVELGDLNPVEPVENDWGTTEAQEWLAGRRAESDQASSLT